MKQAVELWIWKIETAKDEKPRLVTARTAGEAVEFAEQVLGLEAVTMVGMLDTPIYIDTDLVDARRAE